MEVFSAVAGQLVQKFAGESIVPALIVVQPEVALIRTAQGLERLVDFRQIIFIGGAASFQPGAADGIDPSDALADLLPYIYMGSSDSKS